MFVLLFSVLLGLSVATGEANDLVHILKKTNFDDFLSANNAVLVKFYAPWCGHCKSLETPYKEAAKQLEGQAKLAEIDATEAPEFASRHNVNGYPTMIWITKEKNITYKGDRTATSIVNWVMKRQLSAVSAMDSTTVLDEKLAEKKVVVVGAFKVDSPEFKTFMEAAGIVVEDVDDVEFFYANSNAVNERLGSSKLVMFKSFDERETPFNESLTTDNLVSFVNANRMPFVVEFGATTQGYLFQNTVKDIVMMFANKASDQTKSVLECFAKTAKEYKGKVLFAWIDTQKEINGNIMNYFKAKKEDAIMFSLSLAEDLIKYAPEKTLSCETIGAYLTKFSTKSLPLHYFTDEVPKDWDANHVKVLVGKNFDQVAMNKEKAVFVEFYSPRCGHCKTLTPIWEKLAEAYKDVDSVVIAKIDATTNEIPNISIRGYPTLKLFSAKTNAVVDYEGPRDFDGLKSFLAKHASFDLNVDDKEEL